ncbi:MAG TPA: FAD-dependent oxidoreductase [Chthoniobacterales bacterium]|nr:FAD-dependent oxidoreductase [Chthoniobacterales bacterium]
MRPHNGRRVAIVGAGVSGLTCAVLFAEHGHPTTIIARESGQRTTSAAAAAIWFPYDAAPADRVIAWSLETLTVLQELSRDPAAGVQVVELRVFARMGEIDAPQWARALGARRLASAEVPAGVFTSGYALHVPVVDTTIYLDYLTQRARAAGALFRDDEIGALEEIDTQHEVIVNCSGADAKTLVGDAHVEPHRGQVAVVAKLELPYAIVCDDPPLMYAIPRRNDCVLGGTNQISDSRKIAPDDTARIVSEAARVLGITAPAVVLERVGLRPFRRIGVRLEAEQLCDGRKLIHNYGHGGSGFTLSWGCAAAVLVLCDSPLAETARPLT